jgi:phenolic acid decarboxylase
MCRAICLNAVPAFTQFPIDIGQHAFHNEDTVRYRVRISEETGIDPGEHIGVMVGRTTQHDTIHVSQMHGSLIQSRDAAVQMIPVGKLAFRR